jgi:hypothetical protein
MNSLRATHYAILQNPSYRIIILTSVSEVIVSGKGHFHRGQFKLKKAVGLNSHEKQVLARITTNDVCNFHYTDYYNWVQSLLDECITQKLLRKWPLFGIRRTSRTANAIKSLESTVDRRIAKFIQTNDTKELRLIDECLLDIKLPSLTAPNRRHGPDSLAQVNEVIRKGYCFGEWSGLR